MARRDARARRGRSGRACRAAASLACGTVAARQIRRRPAGVITAAPGQGLQPRTRLTRSRAGSARRSQPSSFLSRGAMVACEWSCGRGVSASSCVERAHHHARADHAEPRRELARRLRGAYGRGLGEERVARVHAGIHLEGRDAGLGLAADDGPRDGRGAAIARQDRRVDVDGAPREARRARPWEGSGRRRPRRQRRPRSRPAARASRDRAVLAAGAPADARG